MASLGFIENIFTERDMTTEKLEIKTHLINDLALTTINVSKN